MPDHALDEGAIVGRVQARSLRVEGRESQELADRPRQDETPVRVQVGFAAVVDAAVVPECEGVGLEAEGRMCRRIAHRR